MDNKLIGVRLMDGNEVVAHEHESINEGKRVFSHMLMVLVMPNGQATMRPYVDSASFEKLTPIRDEHIIVTYKPEGAVAEQHEKFVGLIKAASSKIATPPPKKIITP